MRVLRIDFEKLGKVWIPRKLALHRAGQEMLVQAWR
jgi:hypothetical protein